MRAVPRNGYAITLIPRALYHLGSCSVSGQNIPRDPRHSRTLVRNPGRPAARAAHLLLPATRYGSRCSAARLGHAYPGQPGSTGVRVS